MLLRVNYFILFLPASSLISILFKLIQITRQKASRKAGKSLLRVCSFLLLMEKRENFFTSLKHELFFYYHKVIFSIFIKKTFSLSFFCFLLGNVVLLVPNGEKPTVSKLLQTRTVLRRENPFHAFSLIRNGEFSIYL